MAKAKSDHPLVGKIFSIESQMYRVQDVLDQIVFASKMVDAETCQRGRPSKFELSKIMAILGVTTQSLAKEVAEASAAKAAAKAAAKKPEKEEPIIPPQVTPPTEEELEARRRSIANLLAMFPPDQLNNDW